MDNFDQKCHASLVRCVKCGEGRLAFSFKVEKPWWVFPCFSWEKIDFLTHSAVRFGAGRFLFNLGSCQNPVSVAVYDPGTHF